MEWPAVIDAVGEREFAIGVVGAGWVSSNFHLPVLANTDAAQIEFVADIEDERARSAADAFGGSPVTIGSDLSSLPSCDIALLTIPVGVREPYLDLFASRDTPVFTEKPFAPRYATHCRFLDGNGRMCCNYMRTVYSATRQLRAIVNAEPFGRLERLQLTEGGVIGATGKGPDHYQTDPDRSGGGILLETGCHTLSQLTSVLEGYELRVRSADIQWHGRLDVDVRSEIEAERNGTSLVVDYHVSDIAPVGNTARFVFEGADVLYNHRRPDARLEIERRGASRAGPELRFDHDDVWATSEHQAVYILWQTFLSKVARGDSSIAEHDTYPEVTRLITEMYGSGGGHPMERGS